MSDTERRYTPVPVQVRADSGGRRRIGGYAAVFNKLSRNLGGFVEVVTPSFFNHTRAAGWPDVIARYNHDDNMLLGTTGGRTLDLSLDETGLLYEVDPPQARGDIVELVQRGDVRKSSFAFRTDVNGDDWTMTDQGFPLRRLVSGQLVDVAPVNMPAYPDSTAALRSMDPHDRAEMRRLGLGPEAALRSLAAKMEVDLDEVVRLAADNELRRFFTRTDSGVAPAQKPKPRTFGPAAAAALLARRQDPGG